MVTDFPINMESSIDILWPFMAYVFCPSRVCLIWQSQLWYTNIKPNYPSPMCTIVHQTETWSVLAYAGEIGDSRLLRWVNCRLRDIWSYAWFQQSIATACYTVGERPPSRFIYFYLILLRLCSIKEIPIDRESDTSIKSHVHQIQKNNR